MSLFDWEDSGATFDTERVYRYLLWRSWDKQLPVLPWIMLNPSTADENVLDPTITRCVSFSKSWGYGGIEIMNLFALRSTDPKALYSHPDPVSRRNDLVIRNRCERSQVVVAAWGVHGTFRDRASEVQEIVRGSGAKMMCLGITKGGHPKHPLYVKGSTKLVELES